MLKMDEDYFILNLKLNKDDLQVIDMKRKFFEIMDDMEEFLYAKYGEEKFIDVNVLANLAEKAADIQSKKKCSLRQAFNEAHEKYSANIVTDKMVEYPREMEFKGVLFDYDMIRECSDFFRQAEIQKSIKDKRPYYDDDMAWEISKEVFHEIKYSDPNLKTDSAINMVLKNYPAKDDSTYFVLYTNTLGDAAVTYGNNIDITDFFKDTLLEECKNDVFAENYDTIKDKVYSAFETGYFSSPDGSVSFGCSRVNDDMTGSYSINGESCAPWKADSDYLRMADEVLYTLSEENGFVPKQDKSLNFSFTDARGQEVSEPDFINGISSAYYGFSENYRDEKKAGELRTGNGVFEINVWFDDFIIKVKDAISGEFANELSVTRDDIKRSLDKNDFSKEDILSVIKDKVTGFILSDRKMRSAVMEAEREDESKKLKQADKERKFAAEALSKTSDVR